LAVANHQHRNTAEAELIVISTLTTQLSSVFNTNQFTARQFPISSSALRRLSVHFILSYLHHHEAMSFFGFDTNLPRDRTARPAPGFSAPQDAFAALQGPGDEGEAPV